MRWKAAPSSRAWLASRWPTHPHPLQALLAAGKAPLVGDFTLEGASAPPGAVVRTDRPLAAEPWHAGCGWRDTPRNGAL